MMISPPALKQQTDFNFAENPEKPDIPTEK